MRRVLWGMTAAIAMLLIVVTLLVFHTSEIPFVQADQLAGRRLQAKVEQANIAATTGRPQVVRFNESEVNSLIDSQLSTFRASRHGQSNLRDFKIHLVDDRIGIHVALNVYGQEMTIDIAGTLRSENGYIQFLPTSGKVGALPIPESALRTAVRQALTSPQSRNDMRLPRMVSDLRVQDGKLLVTYQ